MAQFDMNGFGILSGALMFGKLAFSLLTLVTFW